MVRNLILIPVLLIGCSNAITVENSAINSPGSTIITASAPKYPDDDFSTFEPYRWEKEFLSTGAVNILAGMLNYLGNEPAPHYAYSLGSPGIRGKFVINGLFKTSLDTVVTSNNLDGSGVTLKLAFDSSDVSCSYVSMYIGRDYGAGNTGNNVLLVNLCNQGTTTGPANLVGVGYNIKLQIERSATAINCLYSNGGALTTLAIIPLWSLSANFGNTGARPLIYFSNPPAGNIDVSVDNWSVQGANTSFD